MSSDNQEKTGFMKKHIWKIIITLTLTVVTVISGLLYMNLPSGNGNVKIDLYIKGGWGPQKIVSELYEEKIISSRTFFSLFLKLRGKTGSMKKGIYRLDDGMSINQVIDIIVSGKTKIITITIPEGYNNRQIGEILARKGLFDTQEEFLQLASSKEILAKYSIPGKDCEGYLFPDTYYFPAGYEKRMIIEQMIKQFISETESLENFPKDPAERHKLVILASIVEREAKLKEERALIAAVFLKRLNMNYPLESCATIQYLFEKPKKRIFYSDLKIESPYNTYQRKGLPPGAIANPGLPSIKATLNPEKTDFMYFVIKGDGGHSFSKTFSDHNRAKRKYFGEQH